MSQVTRSCTSCSTPVPVDAVACPNCGSDLPTSLIGNMGPPSPDRERGSGGEVQRAGTGGLAQRGTLGEEEPDPSRDRLQAALGNGFELGARLADGGFGVVVRAPD